MVKIYQVALTSLVAGGLLARSTCEKDELQNSRPRINVPCMKRELPTRKQNLDALRKKHYDVLIIGGGIIGAGCALEAATRGLKTALVEANDFASGTSSRSSKLLHGSFRDFSDALQTFNISGLFRVRTALRERAILTQLAPHLCQPLPIMLPVYNLWQKCVYWLQLSLYNLMAPSKTPKFYYVNKEESLKMFPIINQDALKGAYIFYECQHDDARMCLSVALTAARHGADICNHLKVVDLIKKSDVVLGAKVHNQLTGKSFSIRAKSIINATGAQTDVIRKMNNPCDPILLTPSIGTHIVLPSYYCPRGVGYFDPKSNHCFIYFLPWQGHTIVGATDVMPTDLTRLPRPTESEVQYLLATVKNNVNKNFEVRRCDVLSVWSGFRALPNSEDYEDLMSSIVNVANSNLISVCGANWTTYRLMAEKAVNLAIRECGLKAQRPASITAFCKLDGATNWSPHMYIRLVQDFGIEPDVAQHMINTYGSNAFKLATRASPTNKSWPVIGRRLHSAYPYIEADVRQGIRDYGCTIVDIVAHRLRIAFLNTQITEEVLPVVANIMAEELKWTNEFKLKQLADARQFLTAEMGQTTLKDSSISIPIKMNMKQVHKYACYFKNLDKLHRGYVTINKCCKAIQDFGFKEVPVDLMHDVLRDIDVQSQGKVNLYEFLLLMSAVVHGDTAYLRYAKLHIDQKMAIINECRCNSLPIERSGGGL